VTAEQAITSLLGERGPGKTICPSEAARRIAGDGGDWRAAMPAVHEASRALAFQHRVHLTWQGERKAEPLAGPYRIGRA